MVLPAVIRSAYAGESLDFLNRIIVGRDTHGVERYLELARGIAHRVTVVLAAIIVLIPPLWAARPGLRRGWAALARGGATGSWPELTLTAAWLGLVVGFAEAGLAWIRFRLAGLISANNNPDVLWMAPLAMAALLVALTAAVTFWLGRRGEPTSYRLVVGGCGFLGFFGLIQGLDLGLPPLRLGLHPVAVSLLAFGAAVQLARWTDRRAGVRRLMRATALPIAVAFLAVAAVTAVATGAARARGLARLTPAPDRPNVILLVLDTVRKESMGLYGYGRPNTPELESLGREAVTFDRAIATSPWTLPTHGSLFTGRFQYELSTDLQQPLDDAYPTLAEYLSERGYATGGFVGNLDYTAKSSGLDRGFLSYRDHLRTGGTVVGSAWLTRQVGRLARHLWPRLGLPRKYAPIVVEEFLDWLEEVEDRPFFAFLNLYDAHQPYEIHEEFLALFPERRPIERVPLADGTFEPVSADLGAAIDGYDTGIALMDRAIGDLRRALAAHGVADNTILIVTSDHGEHLGDHGLMDHLNSLYAQLVLVPLVIHVPGETTSAVRVETAVSLRDIPATILEGLGLPAGPFPGRSLGRFWRGDGGEAASSGVVLSELSATGNMGGDHPHEPIASGPMKSLVRGSLHYILEGDGSEELYDLARDEAELHDLAGVDTTRALRSELRAELEAIARIDTIVLSPAYRRAGR